MLNKSKIKIGSNRNFGLVFFFVFLIVGLWPLLNEGSFRIWSIIIAIIFLILGLTNSKLLTPLNILWFKFGLFLGSIISPIVMGIVFFLVVTPTGFIMKIMGKDILNKKYDNGKKSYWINRDKSKTTMKQQF
tara:strand:+ start:24 stop:419 length:396 start_codon:yes stop_codon:yes gene_type:complete